LLCDTDHRILALTPKNSIAEALNGRFADALTASLPGARHSLKLG
jgi:hypothetical protein